MIERFAICLALTAILIVPGCSRSTAPPAPAAKSLASGGGTAETDSAKEPSQERVPPGTRLAAADFADLLARSAGKQVVIQVFAESCGPCITEAIGLNERLDAWRKRGIAVIGLGMDDSPESVRTFYQQTGSRIRFPLYCAPWFAEQQEVALTPTLFIYDSAGKQQFRADAESQQEGLLETLEAKLSSSGS